MASYKNTKPLLKPDEYVFRCSHCHTQLIRTVDLYNEKGIKTEYEFCPECGRKA